MRGFVLFSKLTKEGEGLRICVLVVALVLLGAKLGGFEALCFGPKKATYRSSQNDYRQSCYS